MTKKSCLLTHLLTVNLIMCLNYGMFAGITVIYKICKILHRSLQVVYDELFGLNNNLSVYQRDHRYLAIEVFNSILYLNLEFIETVIQRCSVKKGVLQNFTKFTGKTPVPQTCNCNSIKKQTMAQVSSCEFCEIFKNTFFIEHFWLLLLDPCGLI